MCSVLVSVRRRTQICIYYVCVHDTVRYYKERRCTLVCAAGILHSVGVYRATSGNHQRHYKKKEPIKLSMSIKKDLHTKKREILYGRERKKKQTYPNHGLRAWNVLKIHTERGKVPSVKM